MSNQTEYLRVRADLGEKNFLDLMTQKITKTALAFQQLEQGLAELLESGDWQRYLKVQSEFHNYSFNNVLLILSQFPEASRVAGYQHWQELGRQVKKGSKSIKILAPLKCKIEKENDNGELEAKTGIFGFRTVNIFDISQTQGEDLPERTSPLTGDDDGLIDRLMAFSLNNNVPVFFKGLLGNANGCCRYDALSGHPIEIVVDPLLPKQHQAKTLCHEIGHSLLHSRTQYNNHIPRSKAELEAESVAFIVLNYFGIDSRDYSFPYVAGWQQGEDALENLRQSGMRIQKAANKVIEWVDHNCAFAQICSTTNKNIIMSKEENTPIEETAEAQEYLENKKADYDDKIANKEEYWSLKAQKWQNEANARYNASNSITEDIPLGQPILVGHHSERRHRKDIERSHSNMRKSIDAQEKADYYASKTVSTAIASDDPEAIQKLKDKLEKLQNKQEKMKLVNKLWRKAGKPHPKQDNMNQANWEKFGKLLTENGVNATEIKAMVARDFLERTPFSYHLSLGTQEMKRIKNRIEDLREKLEQTLTEGNKETQYNGFTLVENFECDRLQLIFDKKPNEEVRNILKSNSFRWSQYHKAWQRHLNNNSRYYAKQAISEFPEKLF
ncbi:DUF3560 domain-containing protein [Crocosphaera chwakensis]|uniref:DUF3560 domain-containing protein n=1 Tax=Crocosphaera chwakensis CCY0110 TaxID=391612 RepID=A3IY48_9CHRO|nr:DUF3560 domain-containing protein [Crocosphaera chwakensis]EAZ88624.1 hypothetical protein CY0110_31505 [Crocosphaera chwakensis CCY0110]